MKKIKSNHWNNDTKKTSLRDRCQTPQYAIDPLIQYLPKDSIIWECASGEGNISNALASLGFTVISTDIIAGYNFFSYQPDSFDLILTNPPYSIKYKWLQRCYSLSKPFALLLPIDTIGASAAHKLFQTHGVEIILLSPRINFKMPLKGYSGKGSPFSTAWFTYGLNIGSPLSYFKLSPRPDQQLSLL